jgi:DNA-binding XRE family transcriptional regulator
MIAPAQLRAARALLNWGRAECGTAAGVSPETIKNIETGRFQPNTVTAHKIRVTFANRGVGFFDTLAGHQVWGVFLREAAGNDNTADDAGREASEAASRADRMATAIAATIRKRGHCRPRDLEAKGFTRQEIGEAWALASALAAVMEAGR